MITNIMSVPTFKFEMYGTFPHTANYNSVENYPHKRYNYLVRYEAINSIKLKYWKVKHAGRTVSILASYTTSQSE